MESMMSSEQDAKTYIVRALMALGATVPGYVKLLDATPDNRTIDGLRPWVFDHDPEKAVGFCSAAVGRSVLPFAQALGEDMMACFEAVHRKVVPAVVVINPWAENKVDVVLAELPDFDAWLTYAEKVSREVQARDQADADDE